MSRWIADQEGAAEVVLTLNQTSPASELRLCVPDRVLQSLALLASAYAATTDQTGRATAGNPEEAQVTGPPEADWPPRGT